ncbi:bis(5'-nucleosyl)-tetraphosphatase (symmetrical) YqeK [Enterococcus hirae]|nr:bis(5'-nucleosyl)-tetraphosphatase (symmetrical) YqeK [Enterococcus hirae]
MANEIRYHEDLFAGTRAQLIARVAQKISPKRLEHVLGVEETAVALAEKYGADVERASIAALTHDYAKEFPAVAFIQEIKSSAMDPDLLNWGNNIWHGVVGAEFVKRDLGITDPEILDAIRFHTIGAPKMDLLAQIIYVADFIEPHRDFPGVEEVRKIAFADLQEGVAAETKTTLEYLISKAVPIYPKTILTYNYWVPRYLEGVNHHR